MNLDNFDFDGCYTELFPLFERAKHCQNPSRKFWQSFKVHELYRPIIRRLTLMRLKDLEILYSIPITSEIYNMMKDIYKKETGVEIKL